MKFNKGDRVTLPYMVPGSFAVFAAYVGHGYAYVTLPGQDCEYSVWVDGLKPFVPAETLAPVKHVHAELIKQWADGAKIQAFTIHNEWKDVPRPHWSDTTMYRIKPVPKPDVVGYIRAQKPDKCYGGIEAAHAAGLTSWASLNKAGSDNIKCTFDGETGLLKEVSLLKAVELVNE